MLRTKTYTARLKKQTHDNLDTFLLQQKFLYNKALQERINHYKQTNKTLSNIDQRNAYTKFRQTTPEFQKFDSYAQRMIFDRLHKSFQNFFRRVKKHRTQVSLDIRTTSDHLKQVNSVSKKRKGTIQ